MCCVNSVHLKIVVTRAVLVHFWGGILFVEKCADMKVLNCQKITYVKLGRIFSGHSE